MAMTLRCLPNIITSTRIVGALAILFCKPLSTLFYVIYSVCGLSDVLDGWVARKFKLTSELGSKLDSAADLMFYSIMAIKVFPMLQKKMAPAAWCILGIVIILRVFSYLYVAVKQKAFASLHTYLNKITGLAAFFIPYVIVTPYFYFYSILGCSISFVATIEEIFIHAKGKKTRTALKTLQGNK